MLHNWIKLSVPVLALTLAVVGCEYDGGAERLMGPGEEPAFSDVTTTTTKKYRAVKGFCDAQAAKSSSVIVRRTGGILKSGGNVLVIPRDAVLDATLFVMEVSNAGCTGVAPMFVKLEAYVKGTGKAYDVPVGHLGFLQPLELQLTTEPIVENVDANALRVVWQKKDGSQEVYPTLLDTSGKRVVTKLKHFSDYLLAMP